MYYDIMITYFEVFVNTFSIIFIISLNDYLIFYDLLYATGCRFSKTALKASL